MSEPQPIPMILHCPQCWKRHVDEGDFATRPHHTHACQHCGHVWRPAIEPTIGVQFLPAFKNAGPPAEVPVQGPWFQLACLGYEMPALIRLAHVVSIAPQKHLGRGMVLMGDMEINGPADYRMVRLYGGDQYAVRPDEAARLERALLGLS